MARHSSASTLEDTSTPRKETDTSTPHTKTGEDTSRQHDEKSNNLAREGGNDGGPGGKSHIVDVALKRRARLLISMGSIPNETRSLIRYALEIKDPYLAQVVRRVEVGEMTIEWLYVER